MAQRRPKLRIKEFLRHTLNQVNLLSCPVLIHLGSHFALIQLLCALNVLHFGCNLFEATLSDAQPVEFAPVLRRADRNPELVRHVLCCLLVLYRSKRVLQLTIIFLLIQLHRDYHSSLNHKRYHVPMHSAPQTPCHAKTPEPFRLGRSTFI